MFWLGRFLYLIRNKRIMILEKSKKYQDEFINILLIRIALPIRQSTLIGHYRFNGLSREQRKLT